MKTVIPYLIIIMSAGLTLSLAAQDIDYNIKTVNKNEMYFIGITAKTSMATEEATGTIGQLWGRAMQENINEAIPNKVSENVYGLYYDYIFNEAKEYTVMVAYQVKNLDSIPEGMVGYTVPATRFATFTTPKGNMIKVVQDGWTYIWEGWKGPESKNRAFLCDFEEYDGTATDMEAAVVKLYVSLKK